MPTRGVVYVHSSPLAVCQHVEWAIARGSGDLFVVQSRPVTAVPEREKKPEPKSAISLVMSTFGADGAAKEQ